MSITKYNNIPKIPSLNKYINKLASMETLSTYQIFNNINTVGINNNGKGLYFKNLKEKNNNFVSPISPLLYKEKQNIKNEKEYNGNSILSYSSLIKRQNELNKALPNGKVQLLGKKRKLVKGIENIEEKEKENSLVKKIGKTFNKNPKSKKEFGNINIVTNDNSISSTLEVKALKNEGKIDSVKSPKKCHTPESNLNYNKKLINKKCLSENYILLKKDRDEISEKTDENSSKNSLSIFDEDNINLAFNNDEVTNNSLNNIVFDQSEEESKKAENNQSEGVVNLELLKDEKFIQFEKDLKDYLRRIISDKRKNNFFKNVLPESLEIVKKLFIRNNNISPDIVLPIYKNDFLELSLSIEKGGIIRRKLSILKS